MANKTLKDVLGKYGELSPKGERDFANLHGPIHVTDLTPQKPNIADVDSKIKHVDYPTAKPGPETKQIRTSAQLRVEESHLAESSLRLVKTHESKDGKRVAKVYKDHDWDEFRVRHYTDGKHHEAADYHTDDKEDAHLTAQHFCKEETQVNEDHGSHRVKVMKGAGGKYAAFKVYQDGHTEKCSGWYTDRAEANLAAGIKEDFASFVAEDEVIEGFDEETTASEETLKEDFKDDYKEHHDRALGHLIDAARALKKHKQFLEKGGLIHSYHADNMKHLGRTIEDMKDNLQRAAHGAEHAYKSSQEKPVY